MANLSLVMAAIMMVSLASARRMVPLSLTPNVMPTRSNPVFARVNVNMSYYTQPEAPALGVYYALRQQQTSPAILDGVLNQVVQNLEDKCELLMDTNELLMDTNGLLAKQLNSAAEGTPAALTLHHSAPCPRSPNPLCAQMP